MTDPMRREDKNDSGDSEPLALSSTALPCEGWLVTDPADCQQGGLEIHKMNEEKKVVTIRICRICSANE
jgi:hypothetical protein